MTVKTVNEIEFYAYVIPEEYTGIMRKGLRGEASKGDTQDFLSAIRKEGNFGFNLFGTLFAVGLIATVSIVAFAKISKLGTILALAATVFGTYFCSRIAYFGHLQKSDAKTKEALVQQAAHDTLFKYNIRGL